MYHRLRQKACAVSSTIVIRRPLIFLAAVAMLGKPSGRIHAESPASQPAERFMSDEEFLKLGEGFDLEAYIKSSKRLTIDEIIRGLEPISPVEQILANLNRPKQIPKPPALADDAVKRIAELDRRIDALERRSTQGNDGAAQERALDEAIGLNEHVQRLRREAGQPPELPDYIATVRRDRILKKLRVLTTSQRNLWAATESYNDEIISLQSNGQFERAADLMRSQLAIRIRLSSAEDLEVAAGFHDYAFLQVLRDRLEVGQSCLVREFAIRSRLGDLNSSAMAYCLNELACIQLRLGDPKDARDLLLRALTINVGLPQRDDGPISQNLQNLASAYEYAGQLTMAESLHSQALDMRMRMHDGDHPAIAESLDSLALTLVRLGRAVDAVPLHFKALQMYRRLFPGDNSDVAICLNNVGFAYDSGGRLTEANWYYRASLEMYRRLYGEKSLDVADEYNNIGGVLESLGRFEESKSYFERSIEIRQSVLKADHRLVAESLNNLAHLYGNMAQYLVSEQLYLKALQIRCRLSTSDSPDVAQSLSALASARLKLNRLADAEFLAELAVGMNRRVFQGDHESICTSLMVLGNVRKTQGDFAEAERLFAIALEMFERLYGQQHDRVALAHFNIGNVRLLDHRPIEAEIAFRRCLEMTELMREGQGASVEQRAALGRAGRLSNRASSLAACLVQLHREKEALGILERGRGRASLDLLSNSRNQWSSKLHDTKDVQGDLEAALKKEATSAEAFADARAQYQFLKLERRKLEERLGLEVQQKSQLLAKLDPQISVSLAALENKRTQSNQAGMAVLTVLRGLFPAVKAMTLEEIQTGLSPDEAVVCFAFGEEQVLTAVATRRNSQAVLVADGEEAVKRLTESVERIRATVERRFGSDSIIDANALQEIRTAFLPESIANELSGARRWVVLPDGPLNGIPLELLWNHDPNAPQIVYAPSATVYLRQREASTASNESREAWTSVVLGNPDYESDGPRTPEAPKEGVLLADVAADSPAAKAGLRRGDVLLRYRDESLKKAEDLGPAIQRVLIASSQPSKDDASDNSSRDEGIRLAYWRDGSMRETKVPPGRLGVQLWTTSPPDDGTRSIRALDQITRGGDAFSAAVNATEQARLFGGLKQIPGSGREARAIAEVFKRQGGEATLLLGGDARVPKLWEAITSHPPRILHLATHGLTGSADRPMDASLALTQPKEPTPDDIGFLRLEDLIARWGGRLKDCDLVVLSACDTQRGVQKGDSVMSLPLGFFFAGAKTVIASLWQVDDTATQLLMTRFYENLLGQHAEARSWRGQAYASGQRMTKIEALEESKAWLQSLSDDQIRIALGLKDEAAWKAFCEKHPPSRGFSKERDAQPAPKNLEPPKPTTAGLRFAHPTYWAAFVLVGSPD